MKLVVVLDEMVSKSIEELFKKRGHDTLRSVQVLGQRASDLAVVTLADEKRGIALTWNKKDFVKLAARRPTHSPNRFRHAGVIHMRCDGQPRGLKLLEKSLELIEEEAKLRLKQDDQRLFVEVSDNELCFHR